MAILASSSLFFSSSTPMLILNQSSVTPTPIYYSIYSSNLHSSRSSFLSTSSLRSYPTSLSASPVIYRNNASSPSNYMSIRAEVDKKKVLIVNTNSGGHAVIGFYFAKELLGSSHEVTILTVGDKNSDKMKKPPFSRFSEIVSAGGKTVWGNAAEVGKAIGAGVTFDVVLDNNGKDIETVSPVVDWAKCSGAEQFLYISSAGIYKSTDEPPHVEGDVVKADASHVAVEEYITKVFNSWAIFRPQYMIGSGNNKDCEEWFFDRIVRDRPVPIPGSGMQLTNIAHVKDLSSMLTLAVEKPNAASGNIFNCVSDRAVSLDGIAKLCAQAAGRPANIIHYDPQAVGIDAKKAFPFRNMHFYAEPRAAKDILGWQGTTNLSEDLKERFEEYVKNGRDKKSMQFEIDDKILKSLKIPVAA